VETGTSNIDVGIVEELRVDPIRLDRLVASIQHDIKAKNYDGASLRVTRHGRAALTADLGWADRSAGRPLAGDTVFATMSIGKQFTASVALAFVERGLLSLHMPVADLIPEFGQRGKERVTLYHLLTHTSGLYGGFPPIPPELAVNNQAVVDFACGTWLDAAPGERVNYSGIVAHAVVAAMMIAADGGHRSFTQIMNDELFGPLGLLDTSIGIRPDLADRFAPVVVRKYDNVGLVLPEEMEGIGAMLAAPSVELPGVGYVTTSADLLRFAEMLRLGGALDGVRILSPAVLSYAARNHTGVERNVVFDFAVEQRRWTRWPAAFGVGFLTRGAQLTPAPGPFPNLASPNTFGGVGTGSTCFWIDPERDLCFTLLTTGLMEDTLHMERSSRLGDMLIAAIV
jgi:CubicO group peptidase (beta-lactamase class C family)